MRLTQCVECLVPTTIRIRGIPLCADCAHSKVVHNRTLTNEVVDEVLNVLLDKNIKAKGE